MKVETFPAISIGRQYGSGGREIGKKVAALLGAAYFDKELIELAANESGMDKKLLESIDEQATNSLLYSLSTGAFMMGGQFLPVTDLPANDKLFLVQSNIIKKAAKEAPGVFVGRCADYVLKSSPRLVSVFIHAPINYRAARIQKLYDLPENKAQDKINRTDKRRASYYNYYTDRRWGKIENYHLTIDSSCISTDDAAKLIVEFAQAKTK